MTRFRIDVHAKSGAQILFGDRLASIFTAQTKQSDCDSDAYANDSIYNDAGIVMQLETRFRRQRHSIC